MSTLFPEALMGAESRSISRYIADVFGPDTKILRGKRAGQVPRPYWRVDAGAGISVQQAAVGWRDGSRVYVAGFFGTDHDDVEAKVETLQAALRHSVPFRVFDGRWLSPRVSVEADPDSDLDPGTYTISCALLSTNGEETLASEPVEVTLTVPSVVHVYVPAWPFQSPLQGVARVYVGQDADPRRRYSSGIVPMPARGWAHVPVSVLPGPDALPESDVSAVYVGPLKVDQLSVNIFEDPAVDGQFDGILTITASREVWDNDPGDAWRTYQAGEVFIAPADGTDAVNSVNV